VTTGESVGPNLFADNRRRRIPGILYGVIGAAALVWWLVRAGDDPVLVNGGVGVAGILLVVFGAYSIAAGRRLEVDDEAALAAAAVAVQRPMGHASAQLAWRGWTSRPTWRILWYSAEDPPRHRGLVLVDGLDGEVLDTLVEDNPEIGSPIDWSLEEESPG
jgi:hypothetical protein